MNKLPLAKRVQCDEAWSFCYAKQEEAATAKAASEGAGEQAVNFPSAGLTYECYCGARILPFTRCA
jgi:hypothetical protein